MARAKDISSVNFKEEVLESKIPVLVDFWAPWCGPCRAMAPILDELAGDLEGKIGVAKIDTENPLNQRLAMEYEIMSIPNMKLFKDGKVIEEFIGMRPKEMLAEEIENALK